MSENKTKLRLNVEEKEFELEFPEWFNFFLDKNMIEKSLEFWNIVISEDNVSDALFNTFSKIYPNFEEKFDFEYPFRSLSRIFGTKNAEVVIPAAMMLTEENEHHRSLMFDFLTELKGNLYKGLKFKCKIVRYTIYEIEDGKEYYSGRLVGYVIEWNDWIVELFFDTNVFYELITGEKPNFFGGYPILVVNKCYENDDEGCFCESEMYILDKYGWHLYDPFIYYLFKILILKSI